jgi:glycosyltransferase involved in cell wall biosynthesis
VVGAITDNERMRLQTLCRDIGFDQLDILGEVDDAALMGELERADILSCLRNPVLEGASASAIEGMRCGRPIIVADAGFYAELPDDLVFKVPSSVDAGPLTDILERLVSDESLRREIGSKARDWASRRFTAEAYVAILEDLMARFVSVKPLLAVGNRIGQQLAALGMQPDDPAIQRLSKKMNGLFGCDI